MSEAVYKLPYPPSVNGYWRSIGRGRVIISKEGREYREAVCAALRQAQAVKAQGRLDVTIWAAMPDKRKRDLDNICKSLLDALKHGGAYEDDGQIDKLTLGRLAVDRPGWVHVTVKELPPMAGTRWALENVS